MACYYTCLTKSLFFSNTPIFMIALQITMVGYNDKMRTLLETVIGKIAEFEVKADRFSVIKVMAALKFTCNLLLPNIFSGLIFGYLDEYKQSGGSLLATSYLCL